MITVIDYGAGNIGSVDKAFKFIGSVVKIAKTKEDIMGAEKLVLPGVGAFSDAMDNLAQCGFDESLREYIGKNRPFLGICLGMQMLFDYSEEGVSDSGEKVKGLGIFGGSIRKFPSDMGLKVPQVGWNCINFSENSRMFNGINSGEYAYFVHSYYLTASERSVVAARCDYGTEFDAAVECKNIWATQFHPEKSGETGLQMLRNFSKL